MGRGRDCWMEDRIDKDEETDRARGREGGREGGGMVRERRMVKEKGNERGREDW